MLRDMKWKKHCELLCCTDCLCEGDMVARDFFEALDPPERKRFEILV